MDDKLNETVGNICTILGGALLLYPLIDQAAKTIIPEVQKLKSGETLDGMQLLPAKQKEKHEPESKPKDDEISELKRKLAEYEGKSDEQKTED